MWKMRYYLPLVGFVLPTVVIGYGFVIPSSCIRGVNELSVGFGSTVLGAIVTYFAGIRAATRTACPIRRPWRERLARYINRQAASPRGAFGRFLGLIWTFEHREVNRKALDFLGVEATDRVLDVGSGPGWALREAARRASHGHVTGLDVSEAMVATARRRNRRAILAGRAAVSRVTDGELGLAPASFDCAFSVHCIYFWKNPVEMLGQIASALRPDGRLVLAFRADGPDLPARFRDEIYSFYSRNEVVGMLEQAGFPPATIVLSPPSADGLTLVRATRASR
jgi:SAM-dependent methyltransferase